MYQLILAAHVGIAIVLITLVLLQRGKGASMGAAFGSGASHTVFGSSGSGSFLMRVTSVLAALFFITTLSLGYIGASQYKKMQQVSVPMPTVEEQAPAGPQPTAVESEGAEQSPVSDENIIQGDSEPQDLE